jgi:hypothetical protein
LFIAASFFAPYCILASILLEKTPSKKKRDAIYGHSTMLCMKSPVFTAMLLMIAKKQTAFTAVLLKLKKIWMANPE